MSSEPHLTLNGLSKVYNETLRAVDNVDLAVQDGEFVTLVGPSGCGKSTTLRMIAGFVSPTEGTIEMNGRNISELTPDKRDIGMVFQSIALFPHMTVAENISYGMKVSAEDFSQSEMDERVEEMLELIEMPGTEDRYPEELSGGQQQRIGLARSLALQPEVLLLDEPLSALDEKLREQMQTELTRIQQELGVTTVFVTHNQEEAMTMSDRIVVMNDGNFEQVGSPGDVYNEPESVFVADFMGKSNLFPGEVLRNDSNQSVVETPLGQFVTADTSFMEGRPVQVLVRPEGMQVAAAGAESENTLDGTVEIVHLLGSITRYHVRTKDNVELVVEVQSDEVKKREGEEITVSFPPSACRVLPDPQPSEREVADQPAMGVFASE